MTVVPWILAGALGLCCLVLARMIASARRRTDAAVAAVGAAESGIAERAAESARLRSSLGGLDEGIFVLDREQHVVECNAAALDLTGLAVRPENGKLLDLLPWPELREALARLAEGGTSPSVLEFEQVEQTADDERSLLVTVRRLDRLGYVVSLRDHSRIKRLESMRRDFVANVSHELKTPLSAIKGFVETLRDDAAVPEATRMRFLDRIHIQSERLNALVGDLLTLSRLDEMAGDAERFLPCDLAIVSRETVRDLSSLAEQKGIALSIDAPDARLFVRADREGLRQVVSNLVDNAIKYTPEHGTVSVRVEQTREHVRLQVADTGIGLSPDDQERVFERFYRVDRARSRELGGTGLGLSIVKNTVRSFGGEVAVQSAVGRGTVFWVTLPRLPLDQVP